MVKYTFSFISFFFVFCLFVMMAEDSKSNREKVYATDGEVIFGKVFKCKSIQPATEEVLISEFTAKSTIWKSPASKCNTDKICNKGRTLYVIGEVVPCNDSREYMIFSENSWVFKRRWSQLKDLLMPPCQLAIYTVTISKEGEVRNRWKTDSCKPNRLRVYEVVFTTSPMSTVWFTAPGLEHMRGLVAKYKRAMVVDPSCTELYQNQSQNQTQNQNQSQTLQTSKETSTKSDGVSNDGESLLGTVKTETKTPDVADSGGGSGSGDSSSNDAPAVTSSTTAPVTATAAAATTTTTTSIPPLATAMFELAPAVAPTTTETGNIPNSCVVQLPGLYKNLPCINGNATAKEGGCVTQLMGYGFFEQQSPFLN